MRPDPGAPHPADRVGRASPASGRRDCSVLHPLQIKPAGRRDLAAAAAVGGLQRRLEIGGAPAAERRPRPASRPSSAPGDAGTTARRPESDRVAVARTSSRSSVRIGDFAWHCTSRNVVKSCLPDQRLGRLAHRLAVKPWLDAPGAAPLDGQRRAPVDDAIDITPRAGAMTGVEISRVRARPRAPRRGGERAAR